MSTFGDLFKEIRLNRGFSQSEIARRLGMKNNGYISDIESGKVFPEDETLERLAPALEIDLEELLKLKQKAALMEMGIQEHNIFMNMMRIPLLGEVPCGTPKEAIEKSEKFIPLPYDERLAKKKDLFALQADGLSMKDAGILPGDYILIDPHAIVNNKDIVVAMLDGNATLKFFFRKGDYVILEPANEDFKPIKVNDPNFRVVGKMIKKITIQDYF
ncbi:MAG: helix-turn-helix domain-containing protein [Candidatus Dojkabacteria bacterium]|nr:helix-turn-helix domain-containing protein [Candidatus Dojkabacteria bacterium]